MDGSYITSLLTDSHVVCPASIGSMRTDTDLLATAECRNQYHQAIVLQQHPAVFRIDVCLYLNSGWKWPYCHDVFGVDGGLNHQLLFKGADRPSLYSGVTFASATANLGCVW